MKQLLWILAGALVLTGNVVMAADDSADVELEKKLEDARKRLDEAAREVGELTGRLHGDAMQQVFKMVHRDDGKRRAMLGINIGETEVNGKVTGVSPEGVVVLAVTPGGPAAQAGLAAEDVITSLNGTSLKGGGKAANDKLVAAMEMVEPGGKVELEYLRDGKKKKASLEAGEMSAPRAFAMMGPGGDGEVFKWFGGDAPVPPMPPMSGMHHDMMAPMVAPRWAGMELVQLTPKLGEYFGTDKGLLVVRVPEEGKLEIEEGDVVLKIGDREPRDVGHAMRILRSYAPGESTEIEVMRKKRKRKLNYQAPERPAIGAAAPGYHYNFMLPGDDDAAMDIVIERGEGAGGNRELIIRKKHKVVERSEGDVESDEKDIGT